MLTDDIIPHEKIIQIIRIADISSRFMAEVSEKLICYHCGDECITDSIHSEEKNFCCEGCKLVYEIQQENNLCTFYSLNNNPGIKQIKPFSSSRFSFLDDEKVKKKMISFKDKHNNYITGSKYCI